MSGFIKYLQKTYVAYKFEKKYFAYINEGKSVDLEEAVQYAKKLKDFFEPFSLDNVSSKDDYRKILSALGKNLTVLGKTNDILFLTNDLDKAQENVNYLQKAVNVLRQYNLDNSLDYVINTKIAHYDYLNSEVEIFKACQNYKNNPNSLSEEDLILLRDRLNDLNNLFLVLASGPINKDNNSLLKKLYDKTVAAQGPLILADIVIVNALANDVLSKNYSTEQAQQKANNIANINKFLKEYIAPLSPEIKEDFYQKFYKHATNFIEILPSLSPEQKKLAKNYSQEIYDSYITAKNSILPLNNLKM